MSDPPRRAASKRAGKTDFADSSSMRPAWMPPTIGSINWYVSSGPSLVRSISPIDASSPTLNAAGNSSSRRAARRARQLRPLTDLTTAAEVGTPRTSPAGSSYSDPRSQMDDPLTAIASNRSDQPSSVTSAVASGRRARKPSAPRSMVRPANVVVASAPPRRSLASMSSTRGVSSFGPRAAPESSHAAARPLMPPPTTTTEGRATQAARPMTLASIAMKAGSSLSDLVRTRLSPISLATPWASTSMSKRTSR